MIILNDVSFKYKDTFICKNFNYRFSSTGLYAIKGKSGSGKTTLLNMIGGFLSPTEGKITYSEDIMNLSESTTLIFQDNNLFDHLTVIENIKMLCRLNSDEQSDDNIKKVLDDLNIEEYLDTLVGNLSGGERQRVAIAISILMDKKVILADEPFSSLDYDNSINIMRLFKGLSKDRLVIFSSHNLSLLNDEDIITLDLENDSFDKKKEIEILNPSRKDSKRVKLNTFFYIYHRIMGKRWVLRILSIIFFSLLIFLLSFIVCLKGYTLGHVYVETIKNEKIEFVDVCKTNIDVKGFNYWKITGCNFSREQLGIVSEESTPEFSSSPITTGYSIDSLDYTEIIMTDYPLYYLRHYGLVDFNKPEEMIGNTIKIYNPGLEFYIDFTIKDVIKTPFMSYYENGIYTDEGIYNIQEDKCYASIGMNPYMFYFLYYYYDIDPSIKQSMEIRNGDKFYNFDVTIDDSLALNEIILNDYFLEQYEQDSNTSLTKGENCELDVAVLARNTKHTFTLKDVVDEGRPNYEGNFFIPGAYIAYMSKDTYMELQYETSPTNNCMGYHIYDFENPKNLYKIFNQLDMRFKDENNLIIDHGVNFFGVNDVKVIFNEIDHLVLPMQFGTIAILALLVIVSLYSAYSLYMVNKQRFQILEVYGMRRRYELYLLLFENMLMIALSSIIALIAAIPSHLAFDKHLSKISNAKLSVPTFNFGWFVVSICITSTFIVICVCGGYFLSLRRKIKSHISK